MELKKYKLGELIELCDERNSYGYTNFFGLNINKEFMPTWANTEGLDESKYKVVRKKRFVFSGMQTGRDECIRISMYNEEKPIIVSPAYTTFEVTREDIVIPEYFFMLFLSKEKDRFGAFCSDGSIRSNLDWERFVDFDITLPSIEQQRKYVDVYLTLQNNLAVYQSKADELKLVCDGYIEELRRRASKSIPMVRIGDYISKRVEKNSDGAITLEQGINIQKKFITPQRSNSDLYGRKIVRKGDFAYCTQLNNENVAIAYREEEDCVVSSVYDIFYIKDESVLFPLYLMLWFRRSEFGRYVYRLSTGTSYEFLSYEDLSDYKIPLPDITIQKEIANIYKCYIERQRIAEALKEQIKNICPVLIRGSLT
jgi:type I restriction enzyme S subunit